MENSEENLNVDSYKAKNFVSGDLAKKLETLYDKGILKKINCTLVVSKNVESNPRKFAMTVLNQSQYEKLGYEKSDLPYTMDLFEYYNNKFARCLYDENKIPYWFDVQSFSLDSFIDKDISQKTK